MFVMGMEMGVCEGVEEGGSTSCLVALRAANAQRSLELGVEMLGGLVGASLVLKGLVEEEVVVGLCFELGVRWTGRVWVGVGGGSWRFGRRERVSCCRIESGGGRTWCWRSGQRCGDTGLDSNIWWVWDDDCNWS